MRQIPALQLCEVMAGVDNICVGKQDITLNAMKVTNLWCGKDIQLPLEADENGKLTTAPINWRELCRDSKLTMQHANLIEVSIACNNQGGAATNKAINEMLKSTGVDAESIRAKHLGNEIVFPFNARRKRQSTIIENATGAGGYDRRLLVKGASELIINSCSHYIDESG